ncbi:MAG TPA: efflux RND transporter periplasmic adaptor subunit [Rhizomicrobium sp.]|nr:efflux RND transporter periplasmic adaptor subunit [Rhizomicrobium sp.]
MPSSQADTWPDRAKEALDKRLPPRVTRYVTPRMIIMLLIVGAILLLVFGYITFRGSFSGGAGGFIPAQTVATARAQPTQWQTQLRAVATLHAVEGADLATEVAGIATQITFNPGDDVKKGALLIQLRDDSDRAQLAALQASAVLAARTYQRDAALIKANAISKLDYDTALANMNNAQAQVGEQAAVVEKKAIRAPYDGRVGIRQVDVGQYVNAGQTVVTLQQLNPIFADFLVPQQQLNVLKPGSHVALTTDAMPGQTFSGEIVAFDPKVDPATRNIHVRASIQNPDKKLLPGMFGSIIIAVGAPQQRITLPQTAVVFSPYGDTVFVLNHGKGPDGKPQLTAQQRFVTVGETRGDQVAILNGLKPNEDVVSSGQIKLKNGTPVIVNNSVKLPDNPAPTPKDQ